MTTWFITGASSGFGRAFAEYALDKGYNVVAAARNMAALREIEALAPARVLAVGLDVTKPAQAVAAVEAAVARFGRIDVLINNAGYSLVGAFEETPDEELRAMMETNFFGALHVTRAALPQLRAQRAGAVVNISSLGGQLSFAGFGAYSASKFALEGMSEALAQELAPFGVKILIVEPGQFRTALAGTAMRRMAVRAEYKEIVAGMREFAEGMNGTQRGDPYKAAAAIEMALAAERTPLRLQLGPDGVEAVRDHARALLADSAAWEQVGRDTVF